MHFNYIFASILLYFNTKLIVCAYSNNFHFISFSSLICYELPSKLTLDGLLKMNTHVITEETVYYILNGLIEAIDYLSSKQIVHQAILPENIILIESSQVTPMICFTIF